MDYINIDPEKINVVVPHSKLNIYPKYQMREISIHFKRCRVEQQLVKDKGGYYVKIKYDNPKFYEWLGEVDDKIKQKVYEVWGEDTIFKSSSLYLKVPFRYKKFEVKLTDQENYPVTAFELKKDRELFNVMFSLKNVWHVDGTSGCLWVLDYAGINVEEE